MTRALQNVFICVVSGNSQELFILGFLKNFVIDPKK